MLQDYVQHLSNCPKYDVRASEGDKCTCGLDAVMEAYRNHPTNSIQLDENPYCGWCGKFKKTPGNGSIGPLCECPEPHPLPESVEDHPVKIEGEKGGVLEAYGLKTRYWGHNVNYGFGCAECCNGDRCDEDCTAVYKGRRKDCPHCKGEGWIPKYVVTKFYPHPSTEHISKEREKEDLSLLISEVLYTNSHDDSECLRIKFENIQTVINELIQVFKTGKSINQ